MTLRYLAITYAPDGPRIHVHYTTADGPGPGTKARRKVAQELARHGLTEALEALQGRIDVVGESGFTQREDILQTASPKTAKPMRKGAGWM